MLNNASIYVAGRISDLAPTPCECQPVLLTAMAPISLEECVTSRWILYNNS